MSRNSATLVIGVSYNIGRRTVGLMYGRQWDLSTAFSTAVIGVEDKTDSTLRALETWTTRSRRFAEDLCDGRRGPADDLELLRTRTVLTFGALPLRDDDGRADPRLDERDTLRRRRGVWDFPFGAIRTN